MPANRGQYEVHAWAFDLVTVEAGEPYTMSMQETLTLDRKGKFATPAGDVRR